MLIGYNDKTVVGKIAKRLDYLYLDTICKWYIELFSCRDERKLDYYLSFCLIFKDEAPFLKEWLDYHIVIGVSHFYLYNNNSTDDFLEVLSPYISSGIVTLIDWPYEQAQSQAYKHCIETYKNESNWIAFIDADEFVCPKLETDLKKWLKHYDKYPAICVKWLQFGTSGILKHDYNKGVIEQYTSCWEDFFILGKCFVNTRFEVCNWDTKFFHHRTHLKMRILGVLQPIPAISQHFHFNYKSDKEERSNATIQINHYYSKAWDCAQAKMQKSDVFYQDIQRTSDAFFKSEQKCISADYTIMRFLIKMKTKL